MARKRKRKQLTSKGLSGKAFEFLKLHSEFIEPIVVIAVLILISLIWINFQFTTKGDNPQNISLSTPTPNSNYSSLSNVNFSEDYDYPPTKQIPGTVRIPVLMYHHISYSPVPYYPTMGLYVSPEMFDKQMAYLETKNYKSLTPREFLALVRSGKNPIQKSILLTFDDGSPDQYTTAFPILVKHHLTGTFFINTRKLGISVDQLKEMVSDGMAIESHSQTHTDLKKEPDISRLQAEIAGSRADLEGMIGRTVDAFAYPGCVASGTAIGIVAGSYQMAFSCGKSIDHWYSNRYVLDRIHIFDEMEQFKKILSGIWEPHVGY